MFCASSSLKRQAEVLCDHYSPRPYHHAMPKVVIYSRLSVPCHLTSVKRSLPVTCPLVKAHIKLPILSAYPYLTAVCHFCTRCAIRICG